MLYQYKPTGQLVEMISHHGDGIMMCIDSQDEVLYIEREDLIPHINATNEKDITKERLTRKLQDEGVNPPTPTNKKHFRLIPGLISTQQPLGRLQIIYLALG